MLSNGLKVGIGAGVIGFMVLVGGIWSYSPVETGHVGIKKTMGKLAETPLQDGPHFIVPFGFQEMVQVNVKTQNVEATGTAASKDMQTVTSKISVNYHIESDAAYNLLRKVGGGYETSVIAPRIQEALKAVTAKYVAEELISKRDEVSQEVTDILTKKMAEYSLAVEDVNIIAFDFSQSFNEAIEAKQTAQQQALKAENDLKRIEIEAKQKVVQAKAEADSLNAKRSAITPELLELERIEVQKKMADAIKDSKVSTLVIGEGVTPTIPVK